MHAYSLSSGSLPLNRRRVYRDVRRLKYLLPLKNENIRPSMESRTCDPPDGILLCTKLSAWKKARRMAEGTATFFYKQVVLLNPFFLPF